MSHPTVFPTVFRDLLIREVKRRLLREGVPRIKICLEHLSEAEVWQSANAHTVSPGNLILHLCGNVRQWILSGMGGEMDNRNRMDEFSKKGGYSKKELVEMLDALMDEVEQTLDALPPEVLLEGKQIQGFEENGISVLVHVVEHFSYHVGQITYIVKATKNIDLGYYAGADGLDDQVH